MVVDLIAISVLYRLLQVLNLLLGQCFLLVGIARAVLRIVGARTNLRLLLTFQTKHTTSYTGVNGFTFA